jgi:hypothetical protein
VVRGYFKSVRRGRRVLLVGVVCNSVKRARDAHFGRLSKTGPKGAGSHANSGRNQQHRFMRLKVRQRKISSADC